jgi:serine/threonine-protein kinase
VAVPGGGVRIGAKENIMTQPPEDQPETVDQTAPAPGGSDAGATVEHTRGPEGDPGATADPPRPADPAGTTDFVRTEPAGREGAPLGETMDEVPPGPGGTTDFVLSQPGATADSAPATHEAGRTYSPRRRRQAQPGTVAGYEILGELGRGAMGVVYKARQRGLKRLVALKMILAGDHASDRDLARFRAEAESVARLQHANIVQIYEVGDEDGLPFFSLEFVDGTPLSKKVRGTPLPARQAAELLRLLAEAMDYAHRHGVVHRDLKPSNVLLTSGGVPKISDFGLAKQVEEDSGQTRSGTVLGTPSYMAPEQAEGRIKEVGPLSDVYGLGAILYELLTGRAPFRGDTVLETLRQVREQEPVPPHLLQPKVPRDLETICLKCLQKERTKRYGSAADLGEDLRRFLAGEPIRARPVSGPERLARWCRRNPGVAGLAGTVALLLVAIAAVSLGFAWKVSRQNDELVRSNQAEEKARREAERNEKQAIANADEAKATYGRAFVNIRILGTRIYDRLNRPPESDPPSPQEQRALREDVARFLSANLQALAQDFEKSGVTPFVKSRGLKELGDMLAQDLGRKREGLQEYQRVRKLLEPMAAAEPENDLARGNLARVLSQVAEVGADLGANLDRARELSAEAIRLQREITAHPHGKDYSPQESNRLLAEYLLIHGKLSLRRGDPSAGRPDLEECGRLRQELADSTPPQPVPAKLRASSLLSEAYYWLGVTDGHLGDTAAADAALGKAVALCEALANRKPTDFSFNEDLAEIYAACGDARLGRGRPGEAWDYYNKALARVRIALRGWSGPAANLSRRRLHAVICDRLGTAARALPEHRDEAAGYFEDGRKLREALLNDLPGDRSLEGAYVRSLAHCGEAAAALARAGALRRAAPDNAECLMHIAAGCSRCAVTADGTAREQCLCAALAALDEALQRGYHDMVVLRTDPDLEALRREPAGRELLANAAPR